MSTLLLTIILAVALIFVALMLFAIGWLITGKSKLQPGACGRSPSKSRDKTHPCDQAKSCQLCEPCENKPLIHADDKARGSSRDDIQ